MENYQDLLKQAEEALSEGEVHDALQLCDRAAMMGDEARYHAAVLRGDILLELGDAKGALSSYDSVADPDEQDPDLDCARGVALYELTRFGEAENALLSAIKGDAECAEAYFTLGLIAEMNTTGAEVEYFRRARRLDPERFPAAVKLSAEQFERVVEEALTDLPEPVQEAMENVPVLVAELPHLEDLRQVDPPLSPGSLGMFVGIPEEELQAIDGAPPEQSAILLFKRNLERAFPQRDELVHEIRVTVMHEVGHAIGMSEDELEKLGLH